MSPDAVAEDVYEAVVADRFYILTHPTQTDVLVHARLDDVLSGRTPSPLALGGS